MLDIGFPRAFGIRSFSGTRNFAFQGPGCNPMGSNPGFFVIIRNHRVDRKGINPQVVL
jgi:hypothetical protein